MDSIRAEAMLFRSTWFHHRIPSRSCTCTTVKQGQGFQPQHPVSYRPCPNRAFPHGAAIFAQKLIPWRRFQTSTSIRWHLRRHRRHFNHWRHHWHAKNLPRRNAKVVSRATQLTGEPDFARWMLRPRDFPSHSLSPSA